jgi:hypothetical protein
MACARVSRPELPITQQMLAKVALCTILHHATRLSNVIRSQSRETHRSGTRCDRAALIADRNETKSYKPSPNDMCGRAVPCRAVPLSSRPWAAAPTSYRRRKFPARRTRGDREPNARRTRQNRGGRVRPTPRTRKTAELLSGRWLAEITLREVVRPNYSRELSAAPARNAERCDPARMSERRPRNASFAADMRRKRGPARISARGNARSTKRRQEANFWERAIRERKRGGNARSRNAGPWARNADGTRDPKRVIPGMPTQREGL